MSPLNGPAFSDLVSHAANTQPSLKSVVLWQLWGNPRAWKFIISATSAGEVVVGEPEVVSIPFREREWLENLLD